MPPSITLRTTNLVTFAPIAGATVTINSTNGLHTGTTDASGYVTFTGIDLLISQNSALVSASGYKSSVHEVADGVTINLESGSGWRLPTPGAVPGSPYSFLMYGTTRSAFPPNWNSFTGTLGWDFEIEFENLVTGETFSYLKRQWTPGSPVSFSGLKQGYYKWTMTVLNDLHSPPPQPQTNIGFCYTGDSSSSTPSVCLWIYSHGDSQSVPDPPEPPPALGKALTVAYTPLRHRLRGFILADALSVERFDDAWTPAVAATVSIEASGVSGHDLLWRPDSVGEVVYAKAGTVYGRYSRDQGRSWSVADSIGTGDDACQAIDYRRGLKLVGLYDEAAEEWSIVVGTQDSDGEWGSWTSPATLASSAQPSAALTIRPDGIAEFDYTTTGGTRTTLRCRSFSSSSAGTWS